MASISGVNNCTQLFRGSHYPPFAADQRIFSRTTVRPIPSRTYMDMLILIGLLVHELDAHSLESVSA